MKEVPFEESLTAAEIACKNALHSLFDRVESKRATNPGMPDCNVFDIGYVATGDTLTFPSSAYHFRAALDLYRRDRTELQRAIMRILATLPINEDNNIEANLRETSNVVHFRVAPETNAVTAITTTNVNPDKDAKPIPTYTVTVSFDVVFMAKRN